ncbi:unnamed protein product [Bursaphelenchus xylophilus]|uniref:(pine wood nematode) hypothetical protein n=1 Tax=Bursaphelenchus xylophilus TaxID=6326 RepID=A0A1I7RVE2_BURXY|nr:unnamed protein product [Bursaphelenchus xylophilus]CAG9086728.1 unnamed protein product [Bursaphelenchus xylophilus]
MALSHQSAIKNPPAESLAASSTLETDESLLAQVDALQKRNSSHKRISQVRERARAIDLCLQKCRNTIPVDEANGALLYVKCLALIEETERILNTQNPGGRQSSMSQPSLASKLYLTEAAPHPPPKAVDIWSHPDVIQPAKVEDDYYYSYYKPRWWGFLCFNSGKEAKGKDQDVRDLWATQVEFFLSCLGFIVGVGNTLRFPAMIYQHGGIFFVPYFVFLAIFGLPLVYMHLCIGQYSGLSASGAFWKMMPMASGIGWALVLLAVPVAIYYNIIVAWGLYYLWYSLLGFFTADLPWSDCKAEWVTRFNCCELDAGPTCFDNPYSITAAESFFHYQVLNRTMIRDMSVGSVQTHLVVALAIAWILVFLGVFKGIGSIGWAVTLTATVPYLLLIILLIRGLSLNGASNGIKFFLTPDFTKLWSISIWKSAAEQVFYSLGIDAGPLISMASFSRYRNNIYRDAVLLVLLDTITSILCGLVIFSFVGFLAAVQHSEITDILKHDRLYLAFTVYPGVTQFLEWGALWAVLFFFMLIISAMDAEFAWLEMIASSIMNQLGNKTRLVETRILVGLCFAFFIMGIPLCTRGGIFIFHSIESLNANWNSFSLSLIQIIIVCYIYGINNFMDDMSEMLRVEKPTLEWSPVNCKWYFRYKQLQFLFGPTGDYVKLSWCVFAPFILTTLLIASVLSYERVQFNEFDMSWGYEVIAWIAMVGPLVIVPITIGYSIYEAKKRKKPLSSIISTKNWRNSQENQPKQPSHTADNDSDYMYIDPISRVASTKSRNKVDLNVIDEDAYVRAHERIREWAERSGRSEPVRQLEVSALQESMDIEPKIEIKGPEEIPEEEEEFEEIEEESYGRRTGRLKDFMLHAEKRREASSSDSDDYTMGSDDRKKPKRPTVKKSPLMKPQSTNSSLNLFGPPPFPSSQASDSRISKNRANRRSDQRKNRIFANSFSMVVMEPPSSSSPSKASSEERAPSQSASVPDRPLNWSRRHGLGPRNSSESVNNSLSGVSLKPFSISTPQGSLKQSKTIKLKRPKPIGNLPQRPPVDSDDDEHLATLSRASSKSYL